jgi:DNA-binding GntR family transcriptional regulator
MDMTTEKNNAGRRVSRVPPRYLWLRECLVNDIKTGRYPVGTLLPPESELVRTYGVSRHTVREATRKLAETGLISRHPGIGTIVRNQEPAQPYVSPLGALRELNQYTSTTWLELLSVDTVVMDEKQARDLECEPGSTWLELCARRHADGTVDPIAYARIYLLPEFAGLEKRLRGRHMSIYAMLERFYGQKIAVIRQTIQAALMPTDAARLLAVKPRSAALLVRRSYYSEEGRLLTMSSNLHAAERFQLQHSWDRRQQS